MVSLSRKLLTDPLNETLYELCYPYCDLSNNLGFCKSPCVNFCYTFCPYDLAPPPTSPGSQNNHPGKLLITILSILAAAFVLVSCYALYVKLCLHPSRRRRRTRRGERNERRDEFFDEDHGPVVDHPIWYINTIGLQPSVISSITVFKYKKGEGLVEGTDCSVCLNEFQEDETLRLLPKCSHAFHIPCIDTWLRSHTNCPMCRAPIVSSTVREGSGEGELGGGSEAEATQIGVPENGGRSRGEMADEIRESVRVGGTEEGDNGSAEVQEKIQPLRRSVSLDSMSALKIFMAMESVHQMESGEENSGSQVGSSSTGAGGMNRPVELMASSSRSSDSTGRSFQVGSSSGSVIRSFSCSGKLFSGRYSRNRNSALPL